MDIRKPRLDPELINEIKKEDRVKGFNVDLPESLYWKLKQYLLDNRLKMSDWLRDTVRKL